MLLQPHPREWWAARSSPDLHDCGDRCVLRVRQSPNGDSSHQPTLLSIKQVVLRCSNARQWDSVCRTSGAFRMLAGSFIAVILRFGGWQIYLLATDLILVLLFPSLCLCYLKLIRSKTLFLSIFHTEIFFLRLILPVPLFHLTGALSA